MASGFVARYFERTKHYPTPRFILELALLPFPFKVALGLIYTALGGEESAFHHGRNC